MDFQTTAMKSQTALYTFVKELEATGMSNEHSQIWRRLHLIANDKTDNDLGGLKMVVTNLIKNFPMHVSYLKLAKVHLQLLDSVATGQ